MNPPEAERLDREIGQLLEAILRVTGDILSSLVCANWTGLTALTEERAGTIRRLESVMKKRLSMYPDVRPLPGVAYGQVLQQIREQGQNLAVQLERRKSGLLHAMEISNAGAVQRAYNEQEN
jgi:hypothetical protein